MRSLSAMAIYKRLSSVIHRLAQFGLIAVREPHRLEPAQVFFAGHTDLAAHDSNAFAVTLDFNHLTPWMTSSMMRLLSLALSVAVAIIWVKYLFGDAVQGYCAPIPHLPSSIFHLRCASKARLSAPGSTIGPSPASWPSPFLRRVATHRHPSSEPLSRKHTLVSNPGLFCIAASRLRGCPRACLTSASGRPREMAERCRPAARSRRKSPE